MNKIKNVMGLMSGTSLDGIDISLIKTDGEVVYERFENFYFKYDKDIYKEIVKFESNIEVNLKRKNYKKFIDKIVTKINYKAIKASNLLKWTDLVGFHGQTVLHSPENKISIQLGDGFKLSKLLKKDVVFDFRSNDLKNNGQGAPLAPVYHRQLLSEINSEIPASIINIGGISNMSFWDGTNLFGYDTGPGNFLMDEYCRLALNLEYDNKGEIASKGVVNSYFLNKFLKNDFYKLLPPKSADKLYFKKHLYAIMASQLSSEDILATLTELTAKTIKISMKFLPIMPKIVYITGGGFLNEFLKERLKYNLNIKIGNISQNNINTNFIESDLIAYLAARSINQKFITFPTTTGICKPMSGGIIVRYNDLK